MRRPKLYLPWHAVNGDAEITGTTYWFLGDARGESVEVGSYMAEESVMRFVAEAVNNHDRLLAVERLWKAMVENGWQLRQSPWPEDEGRWLMNYPNGVQFIYGPGVTPEAAGNAAIERLKEGK